MVMQSLQESSAQSLHKFNPIAMKCSSASKSNMEDH